MTKQLYFLAFFLFLLGCTEEDIAPEEQEQETAIMYFPPTSGETWDMVTPESLGWDVSKKDSLLNYLEENGTRAFIVLVNGKIVMEKYWGKDIQGETAFTKENHWYWASAGKTLMAMLTGIAQEQNLLNINDKTSDYLGENWTDMPLEKENLILIKHQLTMSTGLDFTVEDTDCFDPDCLKYKSDAGTEWFYYNAPYRLLGNVIKKASGRTLNGFTNVNIEEKIGMDGFWLEDGYKKTYWSVPRDAARFGLLMLNEGTWNGRSVLADTAYFKEMISTSQDLNPAYGYLTWLNGKSSLLIPGLTRVFNVPLSTNAPADAYAAMGKNGQFIDVIPSLDMVVIRMGEAPDDSLVPVLFHNKMWGFINSVIN